MRSISSLLSLAAVAMGSVSPAAMAAMPIPSLPRRRLPPPLPTSTDLDRLAAAEAKRARRAARRLRGGL